MTIASKSIYTTDMVMILVQESRNKWYLTASAIVFTVVAAAHLAMIIWQMPAVIGGYTIPYEINAMVVIGLGYLATRGFMSAHKL